MSLHESAIDMRDELVRLRHALHREPELGLDLPRTQEKVLAALAGLPLEITTGDGAELGHRRAARRPARARRCCCAATWTPCRSTERTGAAFASQVARRDARLRPRPAHRHAGRRGPAAGGPARRARRRRGLHVPAGRGGLRRREDHDRRGRAGRDGRAAGRRLRPARDRPRCCRPGCSSPGRADDGRRRQAHRDRARRRRARLVAAPRHATRSPPPARWSPRCRPW